MTPYQKRERKKRLSKMLDELKRLFPGVTSTILKYNTRWQLVVAVVLSAQTTDKKVNEVTRELFKKYSSVDDFADADPSELAKEIRSVNYYQNKAKNLVKAAQVLRGTYGGRLPKTVAELTELPGVGRKTANVVLDNAYGLAEGIAVDTHVRRIARKFDLTDHEDPKKIEQDLMEITPQKDWANLTYLFIEFGRTYCPARKHKCEEHPLTDIYPKAAEKWPK